LKAGKPEGTEIKADLNYVCWTATPAKRQKGGLDICDRIAPFSLKNFLQPLVFATEFIRRVLVPSVDLESVEVRQGS